MKKKLTPLLAVAGLAIAVGAAWWFQREPAGAKKASDAAVGAAPGAAAKPGAAAGGGGGGGGGGPVAVEVGTVKRVTLVDDTEAVGTLSSRQSVMLRPEVSGRVARIGFKDGQRVKLGQTLVQFDDSLPQAQLRQAEAQSSIARTQLQRNRELLAQGFVSQSAVDQSAAALEVAQAQVALAQAQLARLRVLAPFDGQAGIRRFDVGDYIKDGGDLVQIQDDSQVWVDYRLPERYVERVRPGQKVDVTLDAMPGRRFAGQVEALDSQVDASGRSLLVRARLDNRDGVLRSGMFARARTTLGTRANALVVPEEALVPQSGKQFLIKVVDGPKGKVSQRLEAKLGARMAGQVEVLEGLSEGELVVTAGQGRLMRGDTLPLRIVQVGTEGAGKGSRKPEAGSGPAAQDAAASGPARAASDAATSAANGRPAV